MKTIKYLSLFGILIFSTSLFAQERKHERRAEHAEAIEKMKREFIQEKLELSEEKAAAYIDLMKEYDEKKRAIRKANRPERRPHKEGAEQEEKKYTEEEAKMILEKKLEAKEKMLALEKEYIAKSMETISAIKVLEYYKAEKEFKEKLLKMLKEKRGH